MLGPTLAHWLAAGEAVAVIEVDAAAGSAPRDAGAKMIVSAQDFAGTIGGGAMEWAAIAAAREMLAAGEDRRDFRQPLGPDIGQCCGGNVALRLLRANQAVLDEIAAAEQMAAAARPAVLIFGAGHVGRALAQTLAALPLSLALIDSRAERLANPPPGVRTALTALPEAEVTAAPPGAAFAVMTHEHAQDFLIVEAALARGDAGYVGMIGSTSKRAVLLRQLAAAGVPAAGLTSPIGVGGPADKRPEIIALAAAAEISAAIF